MSTLVYYDPNQPKSLFYTNNPNDPLIPAGYILSSNTTGEADRAYKTFTAGDFSGGYPAYGDVSEAGTGSGSH